MLVKWRQNKALSRRFYVCDAVLTHIVFISFNIYLVYIKRWTQKMHGLTCVCGFLIIIIKLFILRYNLLFLNTIFFFNLL